MQQCEGTRCPNSLNDRRDFNLLVGFIAGKNISCDIELLGVAPRTNDVNHFPTHLNEKVASKHQAILEATMPTQSTGWFHL